MHCMMNVWYIILGITIACNFIDSRNVIISGYTIKQSNNNCDKPATLCNSINRRDAIIATTTGSCSISGLILPSGKASAAISSEKVNDALITTPTNSNDFVLLNDASKTKFPLVSFGLQIYGDETAYKLTLLALEAGYRNFFASVLAGNQRGFAKAVRDSQVPRNELFICGSVVSNRVQGYDAAKRSTTNGWNKNLEKFATGNIDYLDQIMLDYPGPDNESIRGQWSSFIDMMEQKYTKTLAVSNFSLQQLQPIVSNAGSDPTMSRFNPVVNQLPYGVAYHPGKTMTDNLNLGILVQAWAPLGGSLNGAFDAPKKATCSKIGLPYNKSGSQVALRYIIQKGGAVCTQSKKKEHFVEDLNIFDFSLSPADMAVLDMLA